MRRSRSEDARRADERMLFRLTVAAVMAVLALIAAGIWLSRHPEVRPGPCHWRCPKV